MGDGIKQTGIDRILHRGGVKETKEEIDELREGIQGGSAFDKIIKPRRTR